MLLTSKSKIQKYRMYVRQIRSASTVVSDRREFSHSLDPKRTCADRSRAVNVSRVSRELPIDTCEKTHCLLSTGRFTLPDNNLPSLSDRARRKWGHSYPTSERLSVLALEGCTTTFVMHPKLYADSIKETIQTTLEDPIAIVPMVRLVDVALERRIAFRAE